MVPRKTGAAAAPTRKPAAAAAALPYDEAKLRIEAAIRAIPAGSVSSYGEIARRAGLPGRARLTARVLRDNDDPELPWFRILRADGRLAMPDGSRGYREQTRRLRAEGVTVENGRVRLPRAEAGIDELLWGAPR